MTPPFSPQFAAFLQLAATIRNDHEVAKAKSQNSDSNSYPKSLRGYVQQVKDIVGDWDDRKSAQTHYPVVKVAMQALLLRETSSFPARLTQDEAQKLVEALVNPVKTQKEAEDASFALHEIRRFWVELTQAKALLDLRFLCIKYDLQWPLQA